MTGSIQGKTGAKAWTLLIAVTFALLVALSAAVLTPVAHATVYAVPDSQQAAQVEEADQQAQGDASAADNGQTGQEGAANAQGSGDSQAAESEQIEDDDAPLSSGLGGGEPIVGGSGGFNFFWIVVAGIVAVVAFFVVSTSRVNSNISKMKNTFHK